MIYGGAKDKSSKKRNSCFILLNNICLSFPRGINPSPLLLYEMCLVQSFIKTVTPGAMSSTEVYDSISNTPSIITLVKDPNIAVSGTSKYFFGMFEFGIFEFEIFEFGILQCPVLQNIYLMLVISPDLLGIFKKTHCFILLCYNLFFLY